MYKVVVSLLGEN